MDIPEIKILKLMKKLVKHSQSQSGQLCVHNIACELFTIFEESESPLSEELAKTLTDASTGDARSIEIIEERIKEITRKAETFFFEIGNDENDNSFRVVEIEAENLKEAFELLKKSPKKLKNEEYVYQVSKDFEDSTIPQPVYDCVNGSSIYQ